MSGPPIKTVASGARSGDPRRIRNKKSRLKSTPGIYGTMKTYGGQSPGGFKGGAGTGFGYLGSAMGGRSK